MASNPDPLGPVAPDGSHAQAFATHRARGNGIARFFALTRRLKDIPSQQAGEDNVHTLIAHFHMLSIEPGFAPPGPPPGQEPSATAAPAALRRLDRGNGLVGTEGASTERDYDMALKGLMILLYRYRAQLGPDLIDFIMRELIPDHMVGGHSPSIEIVEQSFLNLDTPETENHLLMIESSRYLINQLKHEEQLKHGETPDPKFDNKANGLQAWLLGFMQTFLRHDFLEFNSRPYQRLALHPMLNLYEFARDPAMKRAAQMVLDYVMMKFALSSSRGRRVPPFRRLQHRINHQANIRNYLYSDAADPASSAATASRRGFRTAWRPMACSAASPPIGRRPPPTSSRCGRTIRLRCTASTTAQGRCCPKGSRRTRAWRFTTIHPPS
jgi:hypothetical protein